MSSISRRSLLGYSGTAAAGAALGTATQAEAAADDPTAMPEFPYNTEFSGDSNIRNAEYSEPDGYLGISFKVDCSTTGAARPNQIDPIDIANVLNTYLESRGWPPMTFYGTPVPAPLN
ncbi:twin-arginine translocation signal domain-containing protein [Streptomyces sp. NBC_01390]|uniref:twin-arginine translocation signal domain-containing protein n=1 Tax=Streptomyces sp. NBC_01390 TaxID=2903850 RepID=UPI00324A71F4